MRTLTILVLVSCLAGASDRADLAGFGKLKGWAGGDAETVLSRRSAGHWSAVAEKGSSKSNLGVEWDEPREFNEIRVAFQSAVAPAEAEPEYWVSSWPQEEGRGGWTATDTPWVGEWRRVRATRQMEAGRLVFRFEPLTVEENPNAARSAGWAPRFRRALKVRLRFTTAAPPVVAALEVYGTSRYATREILIETGCKGRAAAPVNLEVYNGRIAGTVAEDRRTRVTVLYTDHQPESNDRTVLTVRSGGFGFGVAVDDLLLHKGIYVRDAGIFLGDATAGCDFRSWLASGRLRPGRDVMTLVGKHEEQSMDHAMAEIPALGMTNRRPYRYIPLGFVGNRQKYGLLFNGNVFIGKQESKLFKDETARMLWEGNTLTFRVGTGATPDFRERERAATQHVLDDDLPVAITEWMEGGVAFREEAFATLLDAPLDPLANRGDETSVLLLRITATNRGERSENATVWLYPHPAETLRLRDGRLENASGRLRATIQGSRGAFGIAELPPEADYRGQAARWQGAIAPGATVVFDLRFPFFTPTDAGVMARMAALDHEKARAGVIAYWRRTIDSGMRLHVPDEPLNRLYRSALQHILLSVYRDVPTGLYMGPCGTFSYNMFANETDMQARLLDMRGLHQWAARLVAPFVALQGSKPLPGRFQDHTAMYNGVRVDAGHDYTHIGYNLNHGWTLWTLAEHYLFTRDREWLRTNWPSMRKAAEWIISERRATMRTDEDGRKVWEYGLLPAGQLEDNEEWLYWYAVNGYA